MNDRNQKKEIKDLYFNNSEFFIFELPGQWEEFPDKQNSGSINQVRTFSQTVVHHYMTFSVLELTRMHDPFSFSVEDTH